MDRSIIADNVQAAFNAQHPNYSAASGFVKLDLPDGTSILARRNMQHRKAQLYFRRVVACIGAKYEVEHHVLVKGTLKPSGYTKATEHDLATWIKNGVGNFPRLGTPYYLNGGK